MGRLSAFPIHQPSVFDRVAQDVMPSGADRRIADGTCVIDINSSGRDQFDEAQSYNMKQAAQQLISACVMRSPNSGGIITGLGSSSRTQRYHSVPRLQGTTRSKRSPEHGDLTIHTQCEL